MTALEVYLNGQRRCVAGIKGDGAITAILSRVIRSGPKHGLPGEEMRLHVGGLDSIRAEHMNWLDVDLTPGDEVRIRIVDVRQASRIIKGSRRPADNSLRRQKAYVRQMAKKFGWKLVKR